MLFITNNELLKSDIIDQISIYAPEFNVIDNGIDTADIIVVDENISLMQELSCQNPKKPLIFLSSKEDVNDSKIYFISKPFNLSVFLDKIKALINIFENSSDGTLEFNSYILYPSRKEIFNTRNQETTKLTEKEVAIIKYLYKNKERIVNKQDLMQEVWDYAADVATHTVETHIYRLRQKVEKDDSSAQLILTSEGGYQLKV